MWWVVLIICLLVSCTIFITREEVRKREIKRKVMFQSLESEWLLVINEEGYDKSIVYSFDAAHPEAPYFFISTWAIRRAYSKKQQLFHPLRQNTQDINLITSIIQKAFGIVAGKAELTKDFKRNSSIYVIIMNDGRRSSKSPKHPYGL